MKKTILPILALMTAVVATTLGQSYMSNPVYKPNARIVIPVQQQPLFAGYQTNVFEFSTWDTNDVETVHSITNIAPVVNTNGFAFADFELFAVDQDFPDVPIFYASSFDQSEWPSLPGFKVHEFSGVELR